MLRTRPSELKVTKKETLTGTPSEENERCSVSYSELEACSWNHFRAASRLRELPCCLSSSSIAHDRPSQLQMRRYFSGEPLRAVALNSPCATARTSDKVMPGRIAPWAFEALRPGSLIFHRAQPEQLPRSNKPVAQPRAFRAIQLRFVGVGLSGIALGGANFLRGRQPLFVGALLSAPTRRGRRSAQASRESGESRASRSLDFEFMVTGASRIVKRRGPG